MEGRRVASDWLVEAERNEPGLLVMGSIYLGMKLAEDDKEETRSPPGPISLPASLWEEDIPLPTRNEGEGLKVSMMLPSGQEVTYNSLVQVSDVLGVNLRMPKKMKVPEPPTSMNKLAARGRIYREETLGAGDITAEDADAADVEILTKLIENAETQMDTKESSDIFCLSLEMSEQEVA